MKKLITTMLLITKLLFPLSYQYNGQKLTIDDKKIEKAFNLGIANFTEEYGDSFNEEELKIIILNNILKLYIGFFSHNLFHTIFNIL